MSGGSPQRRHAAMDLHTSCRALAASCALLLGLLVAPATAQQAQEEAEVKFSSPLDFGLTDGETRVSEEQVTKGRVWLYGAVRLELIQDLALTTRSVLSRVCSPVVGDDIGMVMPVTVQITQDIQTIGKPILGFRIDFRILPPTNGGIQCVDSIGEMAAGPQEPPFDDPHPAPPFRHLLKWEMAQHKPTRFLDLTDWVVKITNITCDSEDVIRPVSFPSAVQVPTDPNIPERECNGDPLPDIDWHALSQSAFQPVGFTCAFAPFACVCAAIPGCGWTPLAGGRGQCRSGGTVDCTHCAIQNGCTPDPAEICDAETSACSCTSSTGDCRWAGDRCVVRGPGQFTPCSACARQAFCDPVTVTAIRPEPLSVIGMSHIGWQINVTFTRQVWIVSAEALIQLQCRTYSGTVQRLKVPLPQLEVATDTLQIQLKTLENPYRTDCDLVIARGSLRDRDHVSFQGYDAGGYTITFPDTAAPVLLMFQPANSQTEVSLNTVITLTFDELVGPGPAAETFIGLMALGAEIGDGNREVDVEVARFEVGGPKVIFDGRFLVINVSGFLQAHVQYSLSIPPGAIADLVGNPYTGLHAAVYAFRTTGNDRTLKSSLGLPLEAVVAICVGVLTIVSVVGLGTYVCTRMHVLKQRVKDCQEEAPAVQSFDTDAHIIWGGEKVVVQNVYPGKPQQMPPSLRVNPSKPSPPGEAVRSVQWGMQPQHPNTRSAWGTDTQGKPWQNQLSMAVWQAGKAPPQPPQVPPPARQFP